MVDKNGIEIKTGDIVKIEDAFFKNDNGIYFVDCSPNDPSWIGSDYSLKKNPKQEKSVKLNIQFVFGPFYHS